MVLQHGLFLGSALFLFGCDGFDKYSGRGLDHGEGGDEVAVGVLILGLQCQWLVVWERGWEERRELLTVVKTRVNIKAVSTMQKTMAGVKGLSG